MQRRGLLIGVAVLLLVAFAVTYLRSRPDTTPVPATREALAAVAVDVLGIKPSSYVPDLERPYGVQVNWHPGGSVNAHHLELGILDPQDMPDRHCRTDCVTWQVGQGQAGQDEIRLEWDNLHVESDPGFLALSVVREGEVRYIVYSGVDIHGDPRDNKELPISVKKLTEVILDDRFASTTTREMTSVKLDKWPEGQAARSTATPTGNPEPMIDWS